MYNLSAPAAFNKSATNNAETGSPREILKLAYKTGFIQNDDVWLTMLKKRNSSVRIYNEEEIDELILLIRDSFIPVFDELAKTLKEKMEEADQEDWNK